MYNSYYFNSKEVSIIHNFIFMGELFYLENFNTFSHIRYGKKFVALYPLDGIKKTPRTFSHT